MAYKMCMNCDKIIAGEEFCSDKCRKEFYDLGEEGVDEGDET